MNRTLAIFFLHYKNKLIDSKSKIFDQCVEILYCFVLQTRNNVPLLTNKTLMKRPRLASGCLVHSSAARVMLNVIQPSVLALTVILDKGSSILSLQK